MHQARQITQILRILFAFRPRDDYADADARVIDMPGHGRTCAIEDVVGRAKQLPG
jgi:hypothetical protein